MASEELKRAESELRAAYQYLNQSSAEKSKFRWLTRITYLESRINRLKAQEPKETKTYAEAKAEQLFSQEGRKNDSSKLRFSLLPWKAIQSVVAVLEFGAKKYALDNWKKVPQAETRYFDAAMRHILAWHQGEKKDPETGFNHLSHAVCCLLFLIWFDQEKENGEKPNNK